MENISLVIFGGSGNLALLKLFPAIYNLIKKNKVSEIKVYAVAKSDRDELKFKMLLMEHLVENIKEFNIETWKKFEKNIFYYSLDFNNNLDYKNLNELIEKNEEENSKRIYYLATSPDFFGPITQNLEKNKMLCDLKSFKSVVIEKPFGTSYKTAKKLNKKLNDVLKEEYIYRIDHFLGKDMIENILYLRFSNALFKSVWSNEFIESVDIIASEDFGVFNRGRYYDDSGAIRDMIQNHLLQILAILTMEMPNCLNSECFTNEKVKIFKKLKTYSSEKELLKNIKIGQYEGYTSEKGVNENSLTETYCELKVLLDSKKWKNVPFYLKTGKNMAEKKLYVVIKFKEEESFKSLLDTKVYKNELVINIQPDEGVSLGFNIKPPNTVDKLEKVDMKFCKSCQISLASPEAYEKIFINLFKGNKLTFTSWQELKYTWKYIDSIIEKIDPIREEILEIYPSGFEGFRDLKRKEENFNENI